MSTLTEQSTIRSVLERARTGHEDVIDDEALDDLVASIERSLYEGVDADERDEGVVQALTARIERHPAYDDAAARVARRKHFRTVTGEDPPGDGWALDDDAVADAESGDGLDGAYAERYREAFVEGIEAGVRADVVDERLLTYDLDDLAEAVRPERDERFDYIAVDTLAQRYFLDDDGDPLELPQAFWMRVAMGIALREDVDDRAERAREFYEVLSTLRFVHSSPTLFHAGTTHPQLASCYVTTVPDDLEGIFDAYKAHAQLSKWSGGLGTDWTPVRASGSLIESTGVESTGTVPFLKISNDVTAAINRSGKRRGAACAYMEPWHLDFPDFLDLQRNTGDERRRTHDMNTAAWVPDLFMKRVAADEQWTLFSPDEVPDLHESYGEEFEELYREYEAEADAGDLRQYERVDAANLWRDMLTRLFETGHPWITFKDACNIRSPQDHAGTIRSSNLCTEITLNTSTGETAVCNLGSVNLSAHVGEDGVDREALEDTVETAMRMLDNVVDLNFYPTDRSERSNLKHRPIGLGMMGFHEALLEQGIAMNSEEAVAFADEVTEFLAYNAVLNSSKLAAERGTYESYEGSKWDRGIFPQDTVALLEDERGRDVGVDAEERLDWRRVREHVAEHGMRNSNTMAVAPTATISTIAGTSASIEPLYSNLYVKSNMSGDFTVVNDHLVADLEQRGLWTDEIRDRLKFHDGSVQEIAEIPEGLRERYRTAFEIDPRHQLRLSAARGVWIDQSQSHNVFFPETDGTLLADVYETAWDLGLKTTYYLRTLGASQFEKSTLDMSEYGRTQTKDRGGDVSGASDDRGDGGAGRGDDEDASAGSSDTDLPSVEDPTCDACQ
ncbi:ribonucleoside-diphosphate reductase subunit alpha [Halosimplex amylolyticum]|uniref:ribonucleoside-diphosphate reductase subunit alpha n=1 Tax=Halosimplex amylolyticum TaxID=3396616 RepID=UPI003F55D1F6